MAKWRAILGYEGIYQVSDDGRVRRIAKARNGPSYLGRENRGSTRLGYRRVFLVGKNGKVRGYDVHVLVAQAFLGPCPPGYEVNHRDSDRSNDRLANLEYVTRSGNMRHCLRAGRATNKLSLEMVAEIRASSLSSHILGPLYGVHQTTIARARRGTAWRE